MMTTAVASTAVVHKPVTGGQSISAPAAMKIDFPRTVPPGNTEQIILHVEVEQMREAPYLVPLSASGASADRGRSP
jgi:hypothetical protein